jgi:hypothetical protein
MKINEIWQQLENDGSFSHGLLLRRYAGSILPDVFVALKAPEKIRCIAATVNRDQRLHVEQFANLRDISVDIIPDQSDQSRQIILFQLLSSQHKDIFSILCEDLMTSIEAVTTESDLIKELINRFEKWVSLFDIAGASGLNGEEQRGLFGELFLLKSLLQTGNYPATVVNTWVGSEKQNRDFQYSNWGIEVKTSQSNNHQRLHIANERQLDTSQLQYLYLFHLSVETKQKSGTTLNDMVYEIREILLTETRAMNKFNTKLMDAGYFDHHITLYNDTGYSVRQEMFYHVYGDFPRIEENDIRNGVGDVKYSIIVSQASEYTRSELQVFKTLNFDE